MSVTTIFENISKAGAITPTTLNGLPGMSSLEIAEITGKKHFIVLRDIRKMLDALKINTDLYASPKCVETQAPDSYGRLQPLTILDKELTFTLLARYSFELSNLVVKRWIELEGLGFERISVKAAVAHLVFNEKYEWGVMKRAPQSQSPTALAHRRGKAKREKQSRRIRANIEAAGGL